MSISVDLKLDRLGTIMEPQPGNPQEADGGLRIAAARGPDGHLHLFPRLVAKGNYSRIGIARVRFDEAGDPTGVERLGIALEPEVDYEMRPDGGGGCEEPPSHLHRTAPALPHELHGIFATTATNCPGRLERSPSLEVTSIAHAS